MQGRAASEPQLRIETHFANWLPFSRTSCLDTSLVALRTIPEYEGHALPVYCP